MHLSAIGWSHNHCNHGSKHYHKKRKREGGPEDGMGQIPKRRDAGQKRGFVEGSLPHFLGAQSDQRAGMLAEDVAKGDTMDALIQEALQNASDEELTPEQQEFTRRAKNRFKKVSERHTEMIQPVSMKMTKKLNQYVKKEKKQDEQRWCQQMSFNSQQRADRFLNRDEVRWMTSKKEDRDTIRTFCTARSVWGDAVEFLDRETDSVEMECGRKVWCVKDTATSAIQNGLDSDTFRSALRKPVLFAAVLFGGYVVDRTWLQKATTHWGIRKELVEPHWQLKGCVKTPLELYVDPSFGEQEEFKELAKLIQAAQSGRWVVASSSIAHGSLLSAWTVRRSRAEVRQPVMGMVLYGSTEAAKENAKKKRALKKEVARLAARVERLKARVPKPFGLAAACAKYKKLKKEVLSGQGTPIGPTKFFKKIAEMAMLQQCG